MKDQPKNIAASTHARLANAARILGRPFGEILQYYGMERFLYRLSKTQYADSFILKGGLVFHSWDIPLRRSTKDIDFLGLLDNRKEIIYQVIAASISMPVPKNGIHFDPASLTVQDAQVDADRKGIRAKFLGYLGRAQMPMQIDFGFSDELTSKAKIITMPTLLHDMAGPQLKTYPVESVVAEKFHTMERFSDVPSRWNDYYDIWLISEHFEIDDRSLQKAIAKTFEKRASAIPTGRPVSLTAAFGSKYGENWKTFLKKSGLENTDINDFSLLVEMIWAFLEWPLQNLMILKADKGHKHWIPGKRKWK